MTAGVTVVCGAPGSGKTRWVAENFQRGDLVVDIDTLYMALSGLPMYDKPQQLLPFVCEARDAIYRRMCRTNAVRHAWIITSDPNTETRKQLRTFFAASVLVMDVTAAVCLERISMDPRRAGQMDLWTPLVMRWYRTFECQPFDTLIAQVDKPEEVPQ
jgi:hypothetical protein